MGICPECQKEKMQVIGTEKFKHDGNIDNLSNWQNIDNQNYLIYTVWYCSKCHILFLRKPNKVYG